MSAYLGLDTSTAIASVALAQGELVTRRGERVTTFSDRLLAMIDELCKAASVAPSSLKGIACAAGPGSFTGLRIGLATAKGLCLATGAPLVLVPTLDALAALAPAGTTVLATVDAFRGELYAGVFDLDAEARPRPRSPALVAFAIAPERLAETLAAANVTPTHAVGDGVAKHPIACPKGATIVPVAEGALAAAVLRLAAPRFASGAVDDARTASPLYVRPSAADE